MKRKPTKPQSHSSAPADPAPILEVIHSKNQISQAVKDSIELLNLHFEMYEGVYPYAEKYGHPHPTDTRGWSQILISALTGILGLKRKKGADLEDGSDVKAANTWGAIDTPRFNGVIKAGTQGQGAGTLASLDSMPHLFFVLWDNEPQSKENRCMVWAVRTQKDEVFRTMASTWYGKRIEVRSSVTISNSIHLGTRIQTYSQTPLAISNIHFFSKLDGVKVVLNAHTINPTSWSQGSVSSLHDHRSLQFVEFNKRIIGVIRCLMQRMLSTLEMFSHRT